MSLNVTQGIQEPSFLEKTGSALKSAGIWLGRVIKFFFWNYLVPAVKAIWEFIKTPYGWSTLAFSAGITLLAVAATRKTEPNTLALRVCLYAAAVLCFMGAGAALTIGCLNSASAAANQTAASI